MSEGEFEMKPEYDFRDAEQGKFYRPAQELKIPFYLDAEIQREILAKAAQANKSASELVNSILRDAI